MKNKLLTGLAALVFMSASCSLPVVKIIDGPRSEINKQMDVCLNLLFEAKILAAYNEDSEMIDQLWQNDWCNDYDKIENEVDKLKDYIKVK
jgi:hypothetical protein